jgi:ATP-dependent DNA helicase RecG
VNTALQNLLSKKMGKKWEDIPVEKVTLKDLNENTIQSFINKAIKKERIPSDALSIDKHSDDVFSMNRQLEMFFFFM